MPTCSRPTTCARSTSAVPDRLFALHGKHDNVAADVAVPLQGGTATAKTPSTDGSGVAAAAAAAANSPQLRSTSLKPIFAYSARACRGSACLLTLPPDFSQLVDLVELGVAIAANDGVEPPASARKSSAPPEQIIVAGSFLSDGAATRLRGTRLIRTLDVKNTLHCIGGVSALLPLLTSDENCAGALRLIVTMIDGNIRNQADLVRCAGPAIMAMLLRDRAVTAITDTLLAGVQSLYATAQLPQLKRRLLEDLLFEFAAWIAAPFAVQRQLLQTLQERAVASIAYFRSTIEVPFMLDILQRFLWFRQPSLSAAALGFDPARRSLSHQEVAELRSMLLTLLMWLLGGHGTLNAILPDSLQAPAELGRQQSVSSSVTRRQTVTGTDRPLMTSGSSTNPFSKAREVGITQEMRLPPPTTAQLRHGIEALLKYVHVAEDRTAITDVLWLIVRLMHDTDSAMAVIEGMSGVPQCFVALLDVDSPAVRMAALRAIGVFLARLSPRARERFAAEFGLTFIVDKLGAFTVDERAYVGVLLLLIGDGGVSCDWPVLSDATTLVNPSCVIALLHLLSLADKLELVRNALKDLSALASRAVNSDAIAALPCWQLWILELPLRVRSLAADGSDELETLFDLATTLLSTVLCRAVRAHADGWRHVEDTLEYVRYVAGSNTQLRGAAVARQILFKLLRGLEADIQQLMSANDVEGAVQLGRNIAYIAVLVEQHALGGGTLTIGDDSEDRTIVVVAPVAAAGDDAPAAAAAPAASERATPSCWRDFALCAKLLDLLDWVLVPPIYSAALDEEVMSALNGPQAAVAGGGGTSSVPTTLPRAADPDAPPASAPAPLPAGYTSLTLFHLQLSLMVPVLEHASTVYGTADVATKQAPLRELHALLHAGASAQEISSALGSRLSDQLRDKLAQTMAPLKSLQRLYDKCTQRLRALLRQSTMALPTAANEARLVQLAHVIGRAIGKSADENSAVGLELLPLFRDLLAHRSLAYLEPDLILAGIVEQQQRVREQSATTTPPPVAATAAFVSTTPAVVLSSPPPAAKAAAATADDNPKRLSSFGAMARARASSATQPASSVRTSGTSSGATSPRGGAAASDDNGAGASVADARNDAMTELARRMAAMLTHSATEASNSAARRMQLVAPHRTARRSALRAQVAGNVDRWRVDSVRRHTAVVGAGAAYHQQACADAAATTALLAARRQLAIDGVRHWWTKRVMRQLTHARAPWFVPTEQSAEHWKLDMAQNHIGMRLRLRRNYTFDQHENATATYRKQQFEEQAASGSELSSKADAALNDQLSRWKFGEGTAAAVVSAAGVAGGGKDDDEGGDAGDAGGKDEASSPSLARNSSFLKEAGRSDGDGEWTVVDDNASTSSQSSLPSVSGEPPLDDERLLVQMVASDRERSVFSTNDVEFVTLHTSVRGRIDVTNASLYFYAETAAAGEGGGDAHEADHSRKTRRWPLAALKSVTRRRYMLKETAVEMLFDTRRSYMLNFESVQVRRRFVKALAATATCEIDTKERSHVDELKRSGYTEMWQRREISNFEYLMQLNAIAGRTHVDLNQYPVFPWVLTDYTSAELDLSNPAVYRDLRKPVGALNEARLEGLRERFASAPSPAEQFLYGTHYSSAGAVLYYLIRLEPYTTQHVMLQDGKFDHADRLFHSVPACWRSVITATSDVKELIPEFYYLPEFLLNADNFELGTTQLGDKLGDVVLPPWANGSAHRFVRLMREALESEIVSQTLHHWIDLIFGYQQRGEAAVVADNVYHPLTYGDIDVDAIDDPLLRAAALQQIANFGQCPRQLLRKPHPRRTPLTVALQPMLSTPQLIRRGKPVRLPHNVARLFRVEQQLLSIGDRDGDVALFTLASASGSQGSALNNSTNDQLAVHLRLAGVVPELAVPISPRMLVTVDNVNYALRLVSLETGKTVQTVSFHTNEITSLAYDDDERVLVSGSRDSTACVWHIVKPFKKGGITNLVPGLLLRSARRLESEPRVTLTGHDCPLSAVALSTDLDLCVTCSLDGTVNLYSPSTGAFVRSLATDAHTVFNEAHITVNGDIILASHQTNELYTYSINATLLARCVADEAPRALLVERRGLRFVSGGDNGVVVRSVATLEVLFTLIVGLRARCLTWHADEQTLVIGLDKSELAIFARDLSSPQQPFVAQPPSPVAVPLQIAQSGEE
jgi:hypothetical protein